MQTGYSNIEIKLGLFGAFCLALLVCMLITYGRVSPLWRGSQEIRVAFDDVNSLSPDDPVRYNGLEVGRVKWLHVMHLDGDNLDRLMPLISKHNLDNLPLPESVRRQLRLANDEDFVGKCRMALQNRTMVELCLEVLQEGDNKRYREDDRVRIVSTVLGDTAVEIISGNGAVNTLTAPKLILGTSGDFFSNLAKSMGDVKEILAGVTDVVGEQERQSVQQAHTRFAAITTRLGTLADFANRRAALTAKRIDNFSEFANSSFKEISKVIDVIEPRASKISGHVKAGLQDMERRASEVQAEAEKASKEVSQDINALRVEVQDTAARSKADLEPLKKKLLEIYERSGGLSGALDGMRDTASWLVSQSEQDVARGFQALKNSLVNLQHAGEVAEANKDFMISHRDGGEHDYNTALLIYRHMAMALRRIHEAGAEAQEVTRMVSEKKALLDLGSAELGDAGATAANPEALERVRGDAKAVDENLMAVCAPLEDVLKTIEDKMLPEFQRKRAAWLNLDR